MENQRNYLTEVKADWDLNNMLALRDLLKEANSYSKDITNPNTNPAFGTPNRAIIMGVIRWCITDYFLEQGCKTGRLKGITAHWRPLITPKKKSKGAPKRKSAGIHALELRGQHTSLIAFHLHRQDEAPRSSKLRNEKRLHNQMHPLLPGFEVPSEYLEQTEGALINLLLVHGDKDSEFAYLRAYYRENDHGAFLPLSDNIMKLPSVVAASETEHIAKPDVRLKGDQKKANEGGSS